MLPTLRSERINTVNKLVLLAVLAVGGILAVRGAVVGPDTFVASDPVNLPIRFVSDTPITGDTPCSVVAGHTDDPTIEGFAQATVDEWVLKGDRKFIKEHLHDLSVGVSIWCMAHQDDTINQAADKTLAALQGAVSKPDDSTDNAVDSNGNIHL